MPFWVKRNGKNTGKYTVPGLYMMGELTPGHKKIDTPDEKTLQ